MSPQRLALAWLFAVALTGFTGCASLLSSGVGDPDMDRRAVGIVWVSLGRSDALPRVQWFNPRALPEPLRCTNDGGPGLRRQDGRCIQGNTMVDALGQWSALVAAPSDGRHSSSVLAHELVHIARLRDLMPWPHHAGELGVMVCDEEGARPETCIPRAREDRFQQDTDLANAALEAAGQ